MGDVQPEGPLQGAQDILRQHQQPVIREKQVLELTKSLEKLAGQVCELVVGKIKLEELREPRQAMFLDAGDAVAP